jgi:serine/threonine protein kinase
LIRQTLKGRVQFEEVFWSTISDSGTGYVPCQRSGAMKEKRADQIAKDFVKGLLTVDPEKRLSAEEALQHPVSLAPCLATVKTMQPMRA